MVLDRLDLFCVGDSASTRSTAHGNAMTMIEPTRFGTKSSAITGHCSGSPFAVSVSACLPSLASAEHAWLHGEDGLTAAVTTFDRTSQRQFETFALTQIRSSIINALSGDQAPRVPPARRQRESTDDDLEPVSIAVLSGRCEPVPLQKAMIAALDSLWSVSDADANRVSLLDSFPDGEAWRRQQACGVQDLSDWLTSLLDESDPGNHGDRPWGEPRDWIAEAMDELEKLDRLVLWLYYYENLRVEEIGWLVCIASGIIPKVTWNAVLRLRAQLTNLPGSLWDFTDDPEGYPALRR